MADVRVYLTHDEPRRVGDLDRAWTAWVDVDGSPYWDASGESPEGALMTCLKGLAEFAASKEG